MSTDGDAHVRSLAALEPFPDARVLLSRYGLPTVLSAEVDTDAGLAALERDKKRTSAGLGFVLLERPGEPRPGQSIDPGRVRAAVSELVVR